MRKLGLRWLRVTLIVAAVGVLLLTAILFGAPHLLEVPAIQTELEQEISRIVQGRVRWKTLDLRLLPRPGGVMRDVEVDIPGILRGRIEVAQAHLQLGALLRGHAIVSGIEVGKPDLQLKLTASSASSSPSHVDPVAAYRSAMEPLVRLLLSFGPDMAFAVRDGHVAVLAEGLPSIQLDRLSLQGRTDGKEVAVTVAMASNFWGRLQVAANIKFSDLSGRASLAIVDLKPQVLLDSVVPQPLQLGVAVADAHIDANTDGRSRVDTSYTLEAPVVQVSRGERHQKLAPVALKGTAILRNQQVEAALSELRLGDVVPAATLEASSDAAGADVKLAIASLDLAELRDAALALAGDDPDVREYAPRVHSGSVSDLRIAAKSPTLENLFDLRNLTASFGIARVSARAPWLEREVADLLAQVKVDADHIAASGVSARIGANRLSGGAVNYAFDADELVVSSEFDLELVETLQIVRKLLGERSRAAIAPVRKITGRAQGGGRFAMTRGGWHAAIGITRSDSALQSDWLPWPIRLQAGNVDFSENRLSLDGVRGSVGASVVSDASASFEFSGPFTIQRAEAKAVPALAEVYPWLQSQEPLAKALAPVTSVSGQAELVLRRLSGRPQEPATLDWDITVAPRNIDVSLAQLPAPISLAGGNLEITPSAIAPKEVTVGMLDARVKVSGKLVDYAGRGLATEGALSEGVVGASFVRWFWARERLPSRLKPKTPFQFSASRVRASGKPNVDLQLAAQFNGGPNVDANLAWDPGVLNIKHLVVRDKRSNSALSLLIARQTIDVSLKGSMYGSTIDAMLDHPSQHTGHGSANLRLIIDREHLEQTTGVGHLSGENLNLTWLLGKPVIMDRVELQADSSVLRIAEAAVRWAEQPATIRGNIKHDGNGMVVDAQIESSGIVIDALLPASGPEDEIENPHRLDAQSLSWLWPLPVTGNVSVHSSFLQYQRHRIEPLVGTLTLEPKRAHLTVQEARLCGFSFPFAAELTPAGAAASVHLAAHDLGFQNTGRCLAGERLLVSGRFDVDGDVVTSGANLKELTDALDGKLAMRARDGKVMKWALLGNILRIKNIAGLFKDGPPKLDDKGFPYKTLTLDGHFQGGRFVIDQGHFVSDAVGLVAAGSIGVAEGDAKLTVLVAPFSSVDRLVRSVPLIGYVIGGTFTSVPVSVNGSLDNPTVVPLGARAIGSELLGVFQRTLKLPIKLLDLTATPPASSSSAK